MAEIAPLTPLRYDLTRLPGGLADVVAPPYDVISPEQRELLAARHPHNVVRLILPEGEGDAKYAAAAETLRRWRQDGVLVRDPEPALYRYDQVFAPLGGDAPPRRRRGFLALVRLVSLTDRVVLPHERTLDGPKLDRLKLFRATQTNLSPGFMLYRDPEGALDAFVDRARPLAELQTSDGVHHALSKVEDPEAIRAVVAGVRRSTLLIADGHHRYETALAYSREVEASCADVHPRGEHRYFMTFLANGDSPDLVVYPTHRHVHSLASFSFGHLVESARRYFDVQELAPGADAGTALRALRHAGERAPSLAAVSGDGRTVVLTLRADADLDTHPTLSAQPSVLRDVDVVVLHGGVLEHLLGISPAAQAAKTNLWYPQDAARAIADVRSGRGQVVFLMNPTPVAQVRRVAEAGHVMPQKSTFFYPKVLTGLAIHTLDPRRGVL